MKKIYIVMLLIVSVFLVDTREIVAETFYEPLPKSTLLYPDINFKSDYIEKLNNKGAKRLEPNADKVWQKRFFMEFPWAISLRVPNDTVASRNIDIQEDIIMSYKLKSKKYTATVVVVFTTEPWSASLNANYMLLGDYQVKGWNSVYVPKTFSGSEGVSRVNGNQYISGFLPEYRYIGIEISPNKGYKLNREWGYDLIRGIECFNYDQPINYYQSNKGKIKYFPTPIISSKQDVLKYALDNFLPKDKEAVEDSDLNYESYEEDVHTKIEYDQDQETEEMYDYDFEWLEEQGWPKNEYMETWGIDENTNIPFWYGSVG